MKREVRAPRDRKSTRCNIRLSDDEMDLLEYLSEKKQTSKSEIIRDALKMYHESAKYEGVYREK